jgi:GNAT superfamily N-acetyltransferase
MNIRTYHFNDENKKQAKRLYDKLYREKLYMETGTFCTYWLNGFYTGKYPYESVMAVAWENRKPIGVAIVTNKEFFGYEEGWWNLEGTSGFLSGYVYPEYRHAGLGGKLFNRALNASGATKVLIADYIKHLVKNPKVKLITV